MAKTPKIEVPKVDNAGIYERVMNIQQEVGEVEKLGENTFHHYKYAKEKDIIAEIKPHLGGQKLALTFDVIREEIVSKPSKNDSTADLTKLEVSFRLVAVDTGEYITTRVVGYGQDSGDKGAPKALTMATKYYLSKMFLIETGTSDDAEDDRNDRRAAAPAKAKKGAAAKAPKSEDEGSQEVDVPAKLATALNMIKHSRNAGGLIQYSEKLKTEETIFNEKQVKELQAAITTRVSEIENQTSKK